MLSLLEREKIADLRRAGFSLRAIGREMGRPASTIMRELDAHTVDGRYLPYAAHRASAAARARPKPAKLAQPGADFDCIHASNDGKVMIFAGGVPIKEGETVIGAVGVSGGTGKQDQGVAEAAAQALAGG